jgi:hypothetical protein
VLHLILIGLHAAAGVIAFIAGFVAIRGRGLFPVHLWSLVATIVLLALAVASDWSQLDSAAAVLFVAFMVLGVFMIGRAVLAGRIRPAPGGAPSLRYVRHVGFNLVALFDAFMVILVLDLGAPIWLVVASGVAFAIVGHYVLEAAERRLVPASAAGNRVDLPA